MMRIRRRRMRRPLSAVLAAAMLFSLIQLPAAMAFDGLVELRTDITDLTLTYEISPLVPGREGDPVSPGYTVETENGSASVFDGLTFTTPGIYEYRVIPVVPEEGEPGVDYDGRIQELTVTVDDDMSVRVSDSTIKYHDQDGCASVDAAPGVSVTLVGRDMTDGMYEFRLRPVSEESDDLPELPGEQENNSTVPDPGGEEQTEEENPAPAPEDGDTSAETTPEEQQPGDSAGDSSAEPEETPPADGGSAENGAGGSVKPEKPGVGSDSVAAGGETDSGSEGPPNVQESGNGGGSNDAQQELPPDSSVPENSADEEDGQPEEPVQDADSGTDGSTDGSAGQEPAEPAAPGAPGEFGEQISETEDSSAEPGLLDQIRLFGERIRSAVQFSGAEEPAEDAELPPVPDTCDFDEDDIPVATNSASGRVFFGSITFDRAGTYVYEISQVIPEKPEEGWLYDDAVYYVTVDVTQDEDGVLFSYVSIEDENGDSVDEILFENEAPVLPADLTVSLPELEEDDEFLFDFALQSGRDSTRDSFTLHSGGKHLISGLEDGTSYDIFLTAPDGWHCAETEWHGTVHGEDILIQVYASKEDSEKPEEPPEGSEMTPEELAALDTGIAGAAFDYSIATISADAVGGQYWDLDCYYVGGRYGSHDTHATDDFSLKYQMEFHTSENIPRDGVEIKIPRALFEFRDGSPCAPSDIAVPKVNSRNDSSPSKNSPFNYFIENLPGQEEQLVFFNYTEIKAGANVMWQVVYNNVKAMQIIDGTEWNLVAEAHVQFKPEDCSFREAHDCMHVHDESCGGLSEPSTCPHDAGVHDAECKYDPGVPCDKGCVDTNSDGQIDHVKDRPAVDETAQAKPLHGKADTSAVLLTLAKKPCTISGKSYGPGLYTESQVDSYVSGPVPNDYAGDNFGQWRFVVWEIQASGRGTQPFDLWMKDTPGNDGKIVGWSDVTLKGSDMTAYDTSLQGQLTGYTAIEKQSMQKTWEKRFYVVVAYPSTVTVDTLVTNDIDMTLVPYDRVDSTSAKHASAQWNYQLYDWHYEGDVIGIGKSVWNDDASKADVGWNDTSTDVSGWLSIFKQDIENDRDQAPDFRFDAHSVNRSFKLTHWTSEMIKELQEGTEERPGLGGTFQAVPGQRITETATRVTTVDDAVYCYPGGTNEQYLLTGDDYYFTSIEIEQQDSGYDVWEDKSGPVETVTKDEQEKARAYQQEKNLTDPKMWDGIDQGLDIYAMFARDNPDGTKNEDWVYVDHVDWPYSEDAVPDKNTVTLNYTFKAADLAKEPYRVKVVHDTVNYDTYCYINVDVHIRPESQTMKTIINNHPDMATIQFENLDGVAGQFMYKGVPTADLTKGGEFWWWSYHLSHDDGRPVSEEGVNGGYYYQDDLTDEWSNYDETSIKEFTYGLYETYLMRDNAFGTGKVVEKDASVTKTGTLTNDPVNGRANATYTITMYEGYLAGSKRIAQILLDNGLEPPNRDEIVIYDLLPAGMNYDPSYQAKAGRLTNVSKTPPKDGEEPKLESWQTQPSVWDQKSVTVEHEAVSTNYNNTGRTMMKFTLHYNGGLPYELSNARIFQGWGLSFRGYWEWKDLAKSDLTENICAVMTADDNAFFAEPAQISKDDGMTMDMDYVYFGPDIDKDKKTSNDEVLFAKAILDEEIATASQSEIEKTVRADTDQYSEFGSYAVVDPGGGYTYEISVTSHREGASDIVIFDRLENAALDRNGVAGETVQFEKTWWHGTFQSVSLDDALKEQLKAQGAEPTLYYNAQRNAKIPEMGQGDQMADILTEANGWYTADDFLASGKKEADVKAIAVSLGTYTMSAGESVAFRVSMKAPDVAKSDDGLDATWAYNNPLFYSLVKSSLGEEDSAEEVVTGNSVEVRLGDPLDLEIVKEYDESDGKVPEGRKTGKGFRMRVYDTRGDAKRPYADHEYTLYTKTGTGWTESGKGATDAEGMLTLKVDQKAVFKGVPDPSRIEVEEELDPFWRPSVNKSQTDSSYIYTVRNKPASVLYVQKKTIGGEGGTDVQNDVFKFKLTVKDGTPAGNVLYWVVDHAYTDGRLPGKLDEGYTQEDGTFELKSGQIIAIIGAADFGETYVIEETDPGVNWITDEENQKRTGEFSIMGSSETFTNWYRWKDLYLTKLIEDRTTKGYTEDPFTFKLELVELREDGTEQVSPVADIEWTQEGTDATGKTGQDGTFTCNAAAGVITLKKLEAEKTYRITETVWGQFYAVVNSGSEDVTMPLYADSEDVTITNAWLKRPLEVSKVLLYKFDDAVSTEAAKKAVFTMTVSCDPDGKGAVKSLANFPFRLIDAGQEVVPGSDADPYGSSNDKFETDDAGTFKIKGGQTAIFDDAGVSGSKFSVTETPDPDYPQLVPFDADTADGVGTPAEGMMSGEGGSTKIVNGSKGSLILRKEWKGLNDGGNAFIEAGKAGSPDLGVDITMTVWKGDEERTVWPVSGDVQVTVVSDAGAITQEKWLRGSSFHLKPWTQLVVNGGDLGDYTDYEVTEENGRHIQSWGDRHIAVNQETPEYGSGAVGTFETDPAITFVNTAEDIGEKSRIAKRFATEDVIVPEGAQLTLIVEKYDGTYWSPAADVKYVLCHGDGYASDSVQLTDIDGKIVIVSQGDGELDWILFPEDTVYVQDVEKPEEGSLRIRELADESDTPWGKLAGIGSFDNDTSYTTDPSEMERTGDTVKEAFVNVVNNVPIQVEKTVVHETDKEFTFNLKQVTSVDGDVYTRDDGITPGNYEQAITETAPGAFVRYRIYDSETGEQTGEGITDEYGNFTLKGGEYAEFDVPEKTLWTVSEDVAPGFVLNALNEKLGGTKMTKLADNLMLFGADNSYKQGPNVVKVKYAVSIYGIGQDVNKKGDVLLTFGPATGEDYTHSYREHSSGDDCIHNMTWTQIIDKANTDPSSLMACLKNGCTKSVELTISGPLKGETVDPMENGDGASVLFDSLNEYYRDWSPKDEDGFPDAFGGWIRSKIRTTLNGSENCGGKTNSFSENALPLLSEQEALISMFPLDLQTAIIPKKVRSVPDGISTADTVFDKLWLFSGRELAKGDSAGWLHSDEGVIGSGYYQRVGEPGNSALFGYTEDSHSKYWWTRSVPFDEWTDAYCVGKSFAKQRVNATTEGISPGFCIPMKQPEYTVVVDSDSGALVPDGDWMAYMDSVGHFTRPNVKEGTVITLPTNAPIKDGVAFKGWALNDDMENLYEAGAEVTVNMALANGADTLTFKAMYGNPAACIHTDDWNTIIENARTDPHVYDDCLKEGCTKSVELTFPSDSPLFDSSKADRYPDVFWKGGQNYVVKYAVSIYGIDQDRVKDAGEHVLTFGPATGANYTKRSVCHVDHSTDTTDKDGASVLYNSIVSDYRKWNKTNSNAGGWPASMIRATLNGVDTDVSDDNCTTDTGGVAGDISLTSANALISAFPAELQAAIGAKAVKSDTLYSNYTSTNNTKTTYDKLWLFSGAEIYQDSGTSSGVIRKNEGLSEAQLYYQRQSADNKNITTGNYSPNIGYNESGSSNSWWLRSLDRALSGYVYSVDGSGDWSDSRASSTGYGLAPGFCISPS